MSQEEEIQLSIEATPNPNSLKYIVNRTFLEQGGVDFPSAEEAKGSLLPEKLFELDWVRGVFVGTNFVTATKSEETDWDKVQYQVVDIVRDVVATGEAVINKVEEKVHADGPDAKKIRDIIDAEIRPAVAMDGGDITFISFKDGIVKLNLRGACSSCPSSIMTLRMGVERRLKQEVPGIKEVMHV